MRFAIICLVSSLLVPALGSSLGPGIERHLPPLPSPYGTITSAHGNFVRYEGPHGPYGIISGSRPDTSGKLNIAPLAPPETLSPGQIGVYKDVIVKAHPGEIARTHFWGPTIATDLRNHHAHQPPMVKHTTGLVEGSQFFETSQIINHINHYGAGIPRPKTGGHKRR